MKRALLLAFLSLFIVPALFGADALIRLAILSGEGDRAPAEEAVAQLEMAMTGILLASGWPEERQLSGAATELKALLATAVARQRVALDARRYVGIVDVRSEERLVTAAIAPQ